MGPSVLPPARSANFTAKMIINSRRQLACGVGKGNEEPITRKIYIINYLFALNYSGFSHCYSRGSSINDLRRSSFEIAEERRNLPKSLSGARAARARATNTGTRTRWLASSLTQTEKSEQLGACRSGETCCEQSEGKEQRRAGLVLSVSQMPRVCTVCTVSPHTSEPSVEATCLIMGNVCIWGKTVAGSS